MKKSTLTKLLEVKNIELEELQKRYDSAESMRKHYSDENAKNKQIIEEMHSTFDAIAGCTPRKVQGQDIWGNCTDIELSLTARFAPFLRTLIKAGGLNEPKES